MTRQALLLAGLLTITWLSVTGCDESNIRGGVLVQTRDLVDIAGLPVYVPHAGVSVNGRDIGGIPGSTQYGTVTSFPFETTDDSGQFVVDNGVRNAIWNSTVIWDNTCGVVNSKNANFTVTFEEPVIGWICDFANPVAQTSPSFATTDALPVSLIVTKPGFSTQYGAPQLRIYLQGTGWVSTVSATSVSPDGGSAVFPFPKQANGGPGTDGTFSDL